MRTKTATLSVTFSLEYLRQIYSVVETFVSRFLLETPHHIVVKGLFNIINIQPGHSLNRQNRFYRGR